MNITVSCHHHFLTRAAKPVKVTPHGSNRMSRGGGARVVILTRSSPWGLGKDAALVEQVLREANATRHVPIASIDHMDPVTFTNPRPVDIQIHLETPCRLAWSWAKVNIVVVNPEWWQRTAWNWALEAADYVVFKHRSAAFLFPEVAHQKVVVIPWRASTAVTPLQSQKQRRFLYLVGGSKHKLAAALVVVSAWQPAWPPLEVWGTAEVVRELSPLTDGKPNIVFNDQYRSETDTLAAQRSAAFHVVASAAEGFGFTMAECASVGALPLWSAIPAYEEAWGRVLGSTGRIETVLVPEASKEFRETPNILKPESVVTAVEGLLALKPAATAQLTKALQEAAGERVAAWRSGWRTLLRRIGWGRIEQPLVLRRLTVEELPTVGIVTITRNRPRWFANMARNILGTDYPPQKLMWVVVDDGEGTGRVDAEVTRFRERTSVGVHYVSLAGHYTVGDKRNRGCEFAAARGAEVFVMMDDDDHYPKSSVMARVTYLKLSGRGCVYCSRIQMYDCCRYISAMNVPPLDLPPSERVSEATLAFTRDFWLSAKFPRTVNVGEGERFVSGREGQTMEVPPEGVIVSFIHGANFTSRRVPEEQEANGCHYGFDDEYFTYLSELGAAGAAAAEAGTNLGAKS